MATIRGGAAFQVTSTLRLEGGATYDLRQKRLLGANGRVRLGVQCCGLLAEVIEQRLGTETNRMFNFSIELANIGSFGSFAGDPSRSTYR